MSTMRSYKLAFLAALALLTSSSYAQAPTNSTRPVVDLGYAQYSGNASFASSGVNVFYGIRYAQAPIGELRWQPPQDIEKSQQQPSGILDAEAPASSCVQGTPAWRAPQLDTLEVAPVTGDEDCLSLDVYVPTEPKSSGLPVMVMIHGGGYTQGSSFASPGNAIVSTSAGSMILVSVQYRLGAFGFLSSSDVRENGKANVGLLDQRAALQWVQRNIRAFGGDPALVTIIGGSAGGGAVMDQMIMYGGVASPPFRGAIAEYPWWQPYHNNTVLESQYRGLLSASSCQTLQCLRALNTSALQRATQQTYVEAYNAVPGLYGHGDFYYGPSIDGEAIRDLPSNEFKQGHFTKVPLLVDHNGYEGYRYSNQSVLTTAGTIQDLQTLFPVAKQSFFDRLYQLYPEDQYNSTFWQRQTLFGDFIINCPTQYMASAVADAGLAAYKIIFNAGTQLHGSISPFLFTANDSPDVNNATLAAYMKDWYISFVTDLDPNARSFSNASKPTWPQYNPQTGVAGGDAPEFAIMSVNYTQVGVIADLDVSPKCDFFHGQSYVVRN